MAVTSFSPKDFGSGKWDGGPATITEPHFEYRGINTKEGPKTLVDFVVTYLDEAGDPHKAKFNVGNAEICRIRAAAADDADESEAGPAISHIDPSKQYRVSPQSEFGQFIIAITAGGFPESKLASGDVTVFDAVELETVTPKGKDEKDRFPLLLPTKVKPGTGAAKAGKSTAATASKAAASTSSKASATPSSVAASTSDSATEAAATIMESLQSTNGGPVTTADVIRAAIKKFKGNATLKSEVVGLLSDNTFLNSGEWVYDETDKTIVA